MKGDREPLWTPSRQRVESSNLYKFMRAAEARWDVELPDYAALWRWSVGRSEDFWCTVWDECGVVAADRGERIVADRTAMPGAQWFPDARLNYAENLLRRRDDGTAIVFQGEDRVRRTLTHRELYDRVSQAAQALASAGVGRGDRVAGFLPNLPETMIAMMATASLGAVWSSCSPDFGVKGLLDRFGQIAPKVLFAGDGYFYAGKTFDSLERVAAIQAELPSLERTVIVPYTREAPTLEGVRDAVVFDAFLGEFAPGDIAFAQVPFAHPLFILYSSGTTGMPKCIVHGHGAAVLQHLKEHRLHCDVGGADRLFYFTTCGWMMWNWLASGLMSGATLLLYDGSPFHPDGNVLFDYAAESGMTIFGTSAKFIDACKNAGLSPMRTHDLSSLRTVLSTGSVLVPESFDYVYGHIKADVHLASISGGTDILGCFVGGDPTSPVWRGELQARALGMAVDVFDADGQPVRGERGELVCTASFPSMPVGFWNDPTGAAYRSAYFEVYPGVWRHGDWCELTEHDGVIIYGRSDAVLNPGGVRIGTAEIYRQVEQLAEIQEGLVIGQEWQGDVRVVLFVRLRDGLVLDDALRDRIRRQIRDNATPRHVPARILQVTDIPRTISGKITELAVREVVHGRPVRNTDAMANPGSLEQFRSRPELAT
jgi:acetoacetyl-CoA synthetase